MLQIPISLQFLTDEVKNDVAASVPVTLMVGGFMVVGNLVNNAKYLHHKMDADREVSAEDIAPLDDSSMVVLQDAEILTPSGHLVHLEWWCVKREAIMGHVRGHTKLRTEDGHLRLIHPESVTANG
jgi:hypothetical protein